MQIVPEKAVKIIKFQTKRMLEFNHHIDIAIRHHCTFCRRTKYRYPGNAEFFLKKGKNVFKRLMNTFIHFIILLTRFFHSLVYH